jgi:hypothetical protein
MLNKNTDKYAVIEWLLSKKYLTESEALFDLGIKNLSARISELKQMGFLLQSVIIPVTKRNGKQTKVISHYQQKPKCKTWNKARFKRLTKAEK